MIEEASLLQKIREKEIEMSVEIDSARRESDTMIEQAKKEAAVLIAGYEQLAQQTVNEYYSKEREAMRKELEELTVRLREEERSSLERAEKHIVQARDLIVKTVLLE